MGSEAEAIWAKAMAVGYSAAVSIPSIIITFNVKKLIMMTYHRWRLPSLPSSVRRLTETMGSSTDIDSSAGFSKQQTKVTNGGFSRESTGITVSSLYERILKKATSSHRQPDDCESGKGDMQWGSGDYHTIYIPNELEEARIDTSCQRLSYMTTIELAGSHSHESTPKRWKSLPHHHARLW